MIVAAPRPEGGERDLLGFETITRAPIDRRLVLPELLDAEERAWLNNYHAGCARSARSGRQGEAVAS